MPATPPPPPLPQISLLAWGLTLAALAWLGYELISIWSHMHSSDASTYCQPALWRGMVRAAAPPPPSRRPRAPRTPPPPRPPLASVPPRFSPPTGALPNRPRRRHPPQANIFIALIVIFVVYSLLLLVVVIVACIAGNKPKAARVDENGKPLPAAPETTLTKVWQTILNFFGLDELAATAPPAPIVEEAPAPGAKAPAAPADGAEEKLLA